MDQIKLSAPIQTGEGNITHLTLRPAKVGDWLAIKRQYKDQQEAGEAALFARLCDVDLAVIEEMLMSDYQKLQEAFASAQKK